MATNAPLTEPFGLHLPNSNDAGWSFNKKVKVESALLE